MNRDPTCVFCRIVSGQGSAVAMKAGLTLHLSVPYGRNAHHIVEALFKAFARALAQSVERDPRVKGVLSTKGKL